MTVLVYTSIDSRHLETVKKSLKHFIFAVDLEFSNAVVMYLLPTNYNSDCIQIGYSK